jgi:hypothetical protein
MKFQRLKILNFCFTYVFKDKKELLEEWTPEPLVPNYEIKESIVNPRVIDG